MRLSVEAMVSIFFGIMALYCLIRLAVWPMIVEAVEWYVDRRTRRYIERNRRHNRWPYHPDKRK